MAGFNLSDRDLLDNELSSAVRALNINEYVTTHSELDPNGDARVWIEIHKDYTKEIARYICNRRSKLQVYVTGYDAKYEGKVRTVEQYDGVIEIKER